MRNGKEVAPMVERKPDMEVNGSKTHQAINAQREREKELCPLRIDKNTVIYVKKEKCTQEYAQEYRERIDKSVPVKGAADFG